ncbi:MAG: efflux RND transporter periplasmic adaptor subunit [Desulfobacterales bacterium]|nr:efflux RND transporter periplasmic adaptor subunit [Desulfobacterales bacterium]
MKKRLILLAAAAAVAGVGIWGVFFRAPADPGQIRLSGNIEVTQVDLAFKLAGRLKDRLVDEGDRVRRGQAVARLDAADYRLEAARAEADLAYAEAVLAELEAGSRPEEIARSRARMTQARFALSELATGSRAQEIDGAKAQLARAQAAERAARSRLDQADADFNRYEAVFRDGGISQQAFEGYRTQRDTFRGASEEAAAQVAAARQGLSLMVEGVRKERIRQARAALAQADAEYALVSAGPRPETIAQGRARAMAARAALNLARQHLADTEIFSPLDGVVLSKSAEPGAIVNPGTPVVTVAETGKLWLRAYLSETDLGRVRLGQPAAVTVDAFPEKTYRGVLRFISSEAEFTPKSVQTFEARVNLVYRVKIAIENADGGLKPGMPADARMEVKP